MNYIGSKQKLSPLIFESVCGVVGKDISQKIFCDLFAGTGIVGRIFKTEVKKVIANDVEYYSYVLNKNYIGNYIIFSSEELIDELNQLEGIKGFIFEEYSQGGKAGRNYFTSENGKKIDAIRQKIEDWKQKSKISEAAYYFLLTSLLESADKIANTASVYAAYLKQIKPTAARQMKLNPAVFKETKNRHQVYQLDSKELIKKIEGDILYLDPPYNSRQYGANYHLLNTIAKYDTFTPKGKTGLRPYYKSDYCKKRKVLKTFSHLIENAQFKHIFLSYNNEGLLTRSEIKKIMERYGKYDLITKKYQRFKADNRKYKAKHTIEYLHILEKE